MEHLKEKSRIHKCEQNLYIIPKMLRISSKASITFQTFDEEDKWDDDIACTLHWSYFNCKNWHYCSILFFVLFIIQLEKSKKLTASRRDYNSPQKKSNIEIIY